MIRPSSRRRLAAGVAAALLAVTATPSSAQFGGVVYDPTNYAQNVLQAARALQQVNNQILSLQNEAASLVNQGRNLASLPISALQDLQGQIQQTRQLLGEAQRIAYDVRQIEQAFASQYRNLGAGTSERALVEGAQGRWENSVAAFEDALKVQAGVVGNIDGSRATLGTLVGASQSSTGALQAAQAGNQLLALQSQQIADLTALLAAQGRAQALEAARDAAAEEEGRVRFNRFMARSGGTD